MFRIKLVKYEKLKNSLSEIFRDLKEGTLVIVDAKLTPAEEANLIEETMKIITDRFSGIELGSIALSQLKGTAFDKFRETLAERILGKKMGITIIGPARLVRRIEKHPEELLVYF